MALALGILPYLNSTSRPLGHSTCRLAWQNPGSATARIPIAPACTFFERPSISST